MRTQKKERGAILVMALGIMMLLSALTLSALNMLTDNIQITGNYINELRAMYIADAGVEDAIDRLRDNINRDGESWSVNYPDPSDDSQKYDVSISKPDASDPVLLITSVGTSEGLVNTLNVSVRVAGSSPHYKVVIKKWEEE